MPIDPQEIERLRRFVDSHRNAPYVTPQEFRGAGLGDAYERVGRRQLIADYYRRLASDAAFSEEAHVLLLTHIKSGVDCNLASRGNSFPPALQIIWCLLGRAPFLNAEVLTYTPKKDLKIMPPVLEAIAREYIARNPPQLTAHKETYISTAATRLAEKVTDAARYLAEGVLDELVRKQLRDKLDKTKFEIVEGVFYYGVSFKEAGKETTGKTRRFSTMGAEATARAAIYRALAPIAHEIINHLAERSAQLIQNENYVAKFLINASELKQHYEREEAARQAEAKKERPTGGAKLHAFEPLRGRVRTKALHALMRYATNSKSR